MQTQNKFEILLVEDTLGDINLTREAIEHCSANVNLNVCMDGLEAINYLKHNDKFSNSVRPDIILLDINLPIKTGFEVLQEVKSDSELKLIPIVMLTTSDSDEDIEKSYLNHASAYITKPNSAKEFFEIFDDFIKFWFCIAKLPHAS